MAGQVGQGLRGIKGIGFRLRTPANTRNYTATTEATTPEPMSASAKINYLDYWGDDLFASVTVTFDSADTMNAPEHWEITWEHFLPCLQRELKSYLQSYAPNFFEIWEAVNALTHPLCGRLFPEKKQLPSRPQLIHDYGCTLRDIGKLDPEACHRFGRRLFFDPEHPEVRALIGIPPRRFARRPGGLR